MRRREEPGLGVILGLFVGLLAALVGLLGSGCGGPPTGVRTIALCPPACQRPPGRAAEIEACGWHHACGAEVYRCTVDGRPITDHACTIADEAGSVAWVCTRDCGASP